MTEFQGKKKEQKENHHTISGLASKNTLMPNPVGNFKNVLRVLSFNIAQILDIVMGWVHCQGFGPKLFLDPKA